MLQICSIASLLIGTLFGFGKGAVTIQDFYSFGPENGDTRMTGYSVPVNYRLGFFMYNNKICDRVVISPREGYIRLLEKNPQVTELEIVENKTIRNDQKCWNFNQVGDIGSILPFYAYNRLDFVGAYGGAYYRESIDRDLLIKATKEVTSAFPAYRHINMEWAFILTWENVPFRRTSECIEKLNTFQVLVTSDGYNSFVMFNYNKLEWALSDDNSDSSEEDCPPETFFGGHAGVGLEYSNDYYFQLPGSCTEDVINLPTTSNVGIPGKWVFKVDTSIEANECGDGFDIRNARILPQHVSVLGQNPITLRGPCLENVVKAECIFHDPHHPYSVDGFIIHDTRAVMCPLPYFITNQRIKVDLSITRTTSSHEPEIYSGSIYTIPPPDDKFSFEINNANNGEITMTWDPDYFGDTTLELELGLMEYSDDSMDFALSGIVIPLLLNSGSFTGPPHNKDVFLGLDSAYYVHLKTVENFILPIYLQSGLMLSEYGKSKEDFIAKCEAWYNSDNGPPSTARLLACPPTLAMARVDGRFGRDLFTASQLNYYHPGADHSYRQVIPNVNGAGCQCVYKNGTLLLGPASGGSVDIKSSHSLGGYVPHFIHDIIPYLACCKFGGANEEGGGQSCRKYYQKRPSCTSSGYQAPNPGNGNGDPHFVTFDHVSYTFNGVGEYWMIKGGAFSMQARLEQFKDPKTGERQPASVFTAFVMQEDGVTVQVQLGLDGVQVIVDGEVLEGGDNLVRINREVCFHTPQGSQWW